MIEYLKGRLVSATPTKTIIEVNNIGYRLHMSLSAFANLPKTGSEFTVYIAEVIRENSHELFGFLDPFDRDLFVKLSEVSGIGPKTALSLIGHLDSDDLQLAIKSSNVTLLSKVPGIGKKTAERLIVDMRDRMEKLLPSQPQRASLSAEEQMVHDGIQALINLGYNPLKAQQAVKKASDTTPADLPALITAALSALRT